MRAVAILVSAAALVCSAAVFAADPLGNYAVEGSNARGGGSYTVTAEKTGDTYRVGWDVGGTRYIDTGISGRTFLPVSYKSGNNTGLALYSANGSNWRGVWAYADGRQIGPEVWQRE